MKSCLYAGQVVHTRLRPVRHRLRYRMLMLLLDLDEIGSLTRRLRFLGAGRYNLFGFNERDHLDGSATPLRAQVEAAMAKAGLAPDGGAIRLLCMPSVLGKVFNPLSIFFCHNRDGRLRAVLYEVNNTFGQRHSYLIPADAAGGQVLRQQCAKQFYVSPFMEMEMQYHFRLALPDRRATVAIDVRRGDATFLTACFAGQRQALTDGALLRAFLRFPLMAGQVLAGIHWEALKLWIKGMRIKPRPAPPAEPISVAQRENA